MRVIIAPDKFKGSLDAEAVCRAVSTGWRTVHPHAEIDLCPMADGGEGTVAALVAATAGKIFRRRVTGPLPEMKVDAEFGILGDGQTAIVEMSSASGLALLCQDDRNPLNTTTFGTGELICAAVEAGAKKIIVGIGGSATIDAGIGCAQACGLPVLLEGGQPVSDTEPLTGRDLEKVLMIKHGRGSKVDRIQIQAACDVSNPLFGPNGAAAVFGPQKGATPEQVRWFDDQLHRLAQRTGNLELAAMSGAGAAGGLGFALAAFFGAKLRPGVEIVIDAVHLEDRLKRADLCITGEGRLDDQSLSGKTAIGVARLCRRLRVPCIALAGSIHGEVKNEFSACYSITNESKDLNHAMANAAELLTAAAAQAARHFKS